MYSIAVLVYSHVHVVPDPASGPSGWLLRPSGPTPSFSDFLTFWHSDMFQVHLVRSLLVPGISHLAKGPYFFSVGMVLEIKIWASGVFVVTGVSLLPNPSSGDS